MPIYSHINSVLNLIFTLFNESHFKKKFISSKSVEIIRQLLISFKNNLPIPVLQKYIAYFKFVELHIISMTDQNIN